MAEKYFNLGPSGLFVTTDSREARMWFDRGLIWCYGFNHEEASRCFKRALDADPTFAMAHWGIAYANGPFYNKTWEMFGPHEIGPAMKLCYDSVASARSTSEGCTPLEHALIEAIAARHRSPEPCDRADFKRCDDDYADAMRSVWTRFPAHADVAALTAEALITRTPWRLWELDTGGVADGAATTEALDVLDRALADLEATHSPAHPGVCHMYIHTLEMSPDPEAALGVADALRDLDIDSGHLAHMPSHIDLLCGHYEKAVLANEKAVLADATYLRTVQDGGFYTSAVCHNWHLMMYAAMFLGHHESAARAVRGLETLLTPDVLDVEEPHLRSTLEAYYSMRIHVPVRFGLWEQIVATPVEQDQELYPMTIVMQHYAKTIAHAAMGDAQAAGVERGLFCSAREQIGSDRRFFNNIADDVIAVAEAMLEGEFAYHQGNFATAFSHLRRAVALDDALHYTEPWAWMHPPRHALGALLLEQGHLQEAHRIYSADLGLDNSIQRPSRHPDNVWSLHGHVECLERLNIVSGLDGWRARRDAAMERADINIDSSCACRVNNRGD